LFSTYSLFNGTSIDATDEEIRELFGQYGKVELVNMPRDRRTGEPRGFAFVDMSSPEEVEAAMSALDGYALGTRRIRVSKSVSKSEVGKQAPASYQKYATAEGTTKLYVGNIPFGRC
jgi:RNA recognition motif-containing protein